MRFPLLVLLTAAVLVSVSPAPVDASETSPVPLQVELLPTPAGERAMTPFVASGEDAVFLSWLEPDGDSHGLWVAPWDGHRWGHRRLIHRSNAFFANWADFSSILVSPSGRLFAHWLEMAGEGTYEYDAWFSWSDDHGIEWSSPQRLHRDGTLSEHGFVSMQPLGDSGFRAVWLDGREMVDASGGAREMTLRFVEFDGAMLGEEVLLDSRVCECCQTAFAARGDELAVAFRDRSLEEVRDIGIVRRVRGRWSKTRIVHSDNWEIAGCPVNGPQLAASGGDLAMAWFTAESQRPRTQVAFSSDFGESFSEPVVVDDGESMGRVDVAPFGAGFAVAYMTRAVDDSAHLMVAVAGPEGVSSQARIAETGSSRASGFPRMTRFGDDLIVAWTESYERGGDSFLKLARVNRGDVSSVAR